MTSRKSLTNDIWRACDIMRSDGGTSGVLAYMEQLSWMLFLKIFEDVEDRYQKEAELEGKEYQRIIKGEYRWSTWTRKDWAGEEIIDFVNNQLIPHLRKLNGTLERAMVATIFKEIRGNRMQSAYNFREVVEVLNEIDFNEVEDSHVVSQVYEELLLKMGQEGGVAGEYYTPRPVIRLMVKITNPQIGEKVLDPFTGSGGFLVESFKQMQKSKDLTVKELEQLQRDTFFGQEKVPLGYLFGVINAILHGITTPNIRLVNTLEQNIRNIPADQRVDVVLTNPPFGGKEGGHIQQNFPIQSSSTELLALQHIMKRLKPGGRCGIVVPEGILFRGNAFARVKKELLEDYNLHTIVSLPSGVFANVTASGQGPKTDLLFFERGEPTKKIWDYEVEGKFTKAQPIKDKDLEDCWQKWQDRAESENSWTVPVDDIDTTNYDLTAKNPNKTAAEELKSPEELVKQLLGKEKDIQGLLAEIKGLV